MPEARIVGAAVCCCGYDYQGEEVTKAFAAHAMACPMGAQRWTVSQWMVMEGEPPAVVPVLTVVEPAGPPPEAI